MILLLFFVLASSAPSQTLPDTTLSQIRFDQKLNTQISSDLIFRDDQNRPIRLGKYFGRKPLVLVLGYYECPMLCTLVLNGMIQTASNIPWSIGREFDVITVSINPSETPSLAAAKKRTYVRTYGRPGAANGWHALTGDDTAIRELAEQVGFRYAYDPASKQFAHPSGLIILTPEGKISHYLFGINFSSQELSDSLRQASANHVGSPIKQLFLLCFHYNPLTGKYSPAILFMLRLLAAATLLALLSLVLKIARRQKTPIPQPTQAPIAM
ncbi:MAG: SCO family protein [Verrucomicrobia bacterium]|nr:MAG: SCO family protein [Verrucomicrobiota bacterium]